MIRNQLIVTDSPVPQRLVPALLAGLPTLRSGQIYKALRNKDVRVNGRRVSADQLVQAGDCLEIFLSEQTVPGTQTPPDQSPLFSALFSDQRLLILNKKPGLAVHGGGPGYQSKPGEPVTDSASADEATLITLARHQFDDPQLRLCHRLDRNTGGLIILARSTTIQREIESLMQAGLLIKRYRCLVRGEPLAGKSIRAIDNTKFFQIEAFLEKRSRQSEVYIHDEEQPGDVPVITRYRILRVFPGFGPDGESVSELEVELVTGRTHQIRAHLAHLGHPILGDGKYGRNSFNRHFRGRGGVVRHQQLAACQLKFISGMQKGPLADLAGRTFQIEPDYDVILPQQDQ